MAEAFTGKWRLKAGSLTGAKDYIAEVEGTEKDLEQITKLDEMEISWNDNTFTIVSRCKGKKPKTEAYILGKTEQGTEPNGVKTVTVSRLQYGKFITDHMRGYKRIQVVRSVKEDEMLMELSSGGKKMTYILLKS